MDNVVVLIVVAPVMVVLVVLLKRLRCTRDHGLRPVLVDLDDRSLLCSSVAS